MSQISVIPTSKVVVRGFIEIKKKEISKLEDRKDTLRSEQGEASRTSTADPDNLRGDLIKEIAHNDENLRLANNSVKLLESMPKGPFAKICVGSVFTIECQGKREHYLMIPRSGGGGCSAPIYRCKITCISEKAPLSVALLSKKAGQSAEFDGKTYEIITVQ